MTQADVAREFKIKPPSVSGWISTGRISKPHFEKLRRLLSDVVGPEHWGLIPDHSNNINNLPTPPYDAPLSEDEWWIICAYRGAKKDTRIGMLSFARAVLPEGPVGSLKRTGT